MSRGTRPPFSASYAAIYDAFYRGKDYRGEATAVDRAIQGLRPGARDLLELGTGTGGHARFFARRYALTGVERSPDMLQLARAKLDLPNVRLIRADLARIRRFPGRYDACVSLFHVLNYLPRPTVPRLLERIASALRPAGVLVVDSWNALAVARVGPTRRRMTFRAGGERIVRSVVPRVDWTGGVCALEIQVERHPPGRPVVRTRELHRMAFYAPTELAALVAGAGFEVRTLTDDAGRPLDPEAWSMRLSAVKRSRRG
jgi:SAM-dependent methyltransferase